MKLAAVATASKQVAATRSRLAKRAAIAEVLRAAPDDEVAIVAAWLSGALPQRRTGVGGRSLQNLPAPATEESLEVLQVDATMTALAAESGPGSAGRRTDLLHRLFEAATESEQRLLAGLFSGELRQGALDGVMLDAVAAAHDLPAATVRRAAMLGGSIPAVAEAAATSGESGLADFRLEVLRPVLPMLAAAAPDLATALDGDGPWLVDGKLDGIRIQVHRRGDRVRVFSRSLDDLTERLPAVVEAVRGLPAETLVLDGEALALDAGGRALPFQDVNARSATRGPSDLPGLRPWFFDLLLHDDEDLLDAPAAERADRLAALAPDLLVPRLTTDDPEAAADFQAEVLAAGLEGVVVKDPAAPYAAGRRGRGWVKVKPRHTVDLVVLAVERGSGRRTGTLSNIHLGARDGDDLVMVGKTFKGMTDEMLAWQTERFTALAVDSSPWVVESDDWVLPLRPEQVVEIAFDGVQRSTRYPGGVALRFARVLRYRDDKPAEQADTLQTLQALLSG